MKKPMLLCFLCFQSMIVVYGNAVITSGEHDHSAIDNHNLMLREPQVIKNEKLQDKEADEQLKFHKTNIPLSLINKIETLNATEILKKTLDEIEHNSRKSNKSEKPVQPQHTNRIIVTPFKTQERSLEDGILHHKTVKLNGSSVKNLFATHIEDVFGAVNYNSGNQITFVSTDGELISTTTFPETLKQIIHLKQDMYAAISDGKLYKLQVDPEMGTIQVITSVSMSPGSQCRSLFTHSAKCLGVLRVQAGSSASVDLFSTEMLETLENITISVDTYDVYNLMESTLSVFMQNSYIFARSQSSSLYMFDNLGYQMASTYSSSCNPVSFLNDRDRFIVVVCDNGSIRKLDVAYFTWRIISMARTSVKWTNAIRIGDKLVVSIGQRALIRIFNIL